MMEHAKQQPEAERLTIVRAAVAKGCSPTTVARMIADGRLAAEWFGHRRLVDPAELEKLLREPPRRTNAGGRP